MSNIRLSHSAISKYGHCPKHYDLYHNQRLRPNTVTAFLPFGRAMDECLNVILTEYGKTKAVTIDFRQLFDNHWQTVEINNTTYNLYDCTLVGYAKADFEDGVLLPEDRDTINKQTVLLCPEYSSYSVKELKEELVNIKSNGELMGLEQRHLKLLNMINWHCLRRKAHLMLDAYVLNVLPMISKVHHVQKRWEMVSPEGVTMAGVIDAIVELVGKEGLYILDNKTSRLIYKESDIRHDRQLAVYAFSEGLDQAAFAVMLKNMKYSTTKTCRACGFVSESRHDTCNKETLTVNPQTGKQKKVRCGGEWNILSTPYCETQFLVDKIPDFVQNTVIDNVTEIAQSIQTGIFPKNLDSCDNFFGERCPMYNKCWKNSEINLTKVEHNERSIEINQSGTKN